VLQSLNSVLQPPEPQTQRCDDRRKKKTAHTNKGPGSRSRKLLKKEKEKEKEKEKKGGASPRGEQLPRFKRARASCLLFSAVLFCFTATPKQLLILYS
jgi:hypothetical protein